MAREKIDPESKRCLEIMVVNGTEAYFGEHENEFPEFCHKDDIISINDIDTPDVFRLYFKIDEFMELDDRYVITLINETMMDIDRQTEDPDPHMDIQFGVMPADGTEGALEPLKEKFIGIVGLMAMQP